MRRKREARQLGETIARLRAEITAGVQVQIDLVPSVVEGVYGVPIHVLRRAADVLKHETLVQIEKNGTYRQASRAHDYRADRLIVGPAGEVQVWRYNEHAVGRNGAPKRRGSQWREWLRALAQAQAGVGSEGGEAQ